MKIHYIRNAYMINNVTLSRLIIYKNNKLEAIYEEKNRFICDCIPDNDDFMSMYCTFVLTICRF